MAGIYIHIPFCKQACYYCNFHFSTSFERYREAMIASICKELEKKKSIFNELPVLTIYFGGGTPSLLEDRELNQIMSVVHKNYKTSYVEEVTIEANPEDICLDKLKHWRSIGINRLSLGVQSFFDEDLSQMNRAHDSHQALKSIEDIHLAGFNNFSVDFMFALPLLSDDQLIKNLDKVIDLNVPHISCYNLTVEEQTALVQLIKKGKVDALSQEKSIRQFKIIMEKLASHKYLQYEISNYAKEGFKSKHNSAYWEQKAYIGFGPSAHSFYNNRRIHNVPSNMEYINKIKNGSNYFEIEKLTDNSLFNEFVMTHLRTSKGLNIRELELLFPYHVDSFKSKTSVFLRSGQLAFFGDEYRLTKEGKLMADYIASEFFEV
jgi:oxygen-independent coproporphyrinogen-3 oxidase